jgi:hypothetical protein
LSTWIQTYLKTICITFFGKITNSTNASACLTWKLLQGRPGRTVALSSLSSHQPSHLNLWIGHRVPQVWLKLVDVDKASIRGAVEHHLGQTDRQTNHSLQTSHSQEASLLPLNSQGGPEFPALASPSPGWLSAPGYTLRRLGPCLVLM